MRKVLLSCSHCVGCLAQTSFEVVSVKLSPKESRGMTVSTDPGRFTAQNATLKFLIQTAYRVGKIRSPEGHAGSTESGSM